MVLRSRGAEAHGEPTENGFLVKKGSRISPNVTEKFKNTLKYPFRLYLETEHIVEDDVFVKDREFFSAAYAASVISGSAGRTDMWKEE